MNTAVMNERDCLFQWAFSQTGAYPSGDSSALGILREIANSALSGSITNLTQMNELACYRAIVGSVVPTMVQSSMNKLACLRVIYEHAYSGTGTVSEFNELSLLRGIVQILYPE